MRCPNCGAENPEEKTFCGDCGAPFKPGVPQGIILQKRVAKQIASVIALISVLLIIIGLGFIGASDNLRNRSTTLWEIDVAHSFYDLAWFFGWLGVAGFLVAGFAYLLSLPIPKKEKEKGLVNVPKPPN